ncbi:MAG: Trm112 family protein [Marinobacter sp.]|uniref:Trm112 family protein n=1 Tax=Marinobacter sp. TaxID=50741 RepID=UPI00299F0B9A|nr:Trm112 family protein [Marinobacter sp.]MDX1633041.1 Trm112 family protein [Marinobacter sp.]
MDKKLVAMLACPVCKGDLILDREHQELVCRNDAMAFPIREGIPVMLATEARTLTTDERLEKRS